ncbi:hypothetical protein [Agrobacterium pusense]|uniref:hypothetical protein n=1 Tax=Agrobacterium pusense TaxID=648995 RepID=UPI002F3F39C8
MKLDARLSRTSALPREMPRKINRLHNFEGPRGRAQILSRFGTAPHLSRRFFCGSWNIAVALLRIIITTGPDIGAK